MIDTSVPGPHLTELGRQQADAVADELDGNNYDGVYASSMIRTQETAQRRWLLVSTTPIVVLPGLPGDRRRRVRGPVGGLRPRAHRICAGAGRLDAGSALRPVLGSTDGNAFDARVDDAVQTIYDSGDRNAVAFSHGATVMF